MLRTQPPTVACKIEAQSEHVTRCVHVFARFASTCMLSLCLLTKFLHRSSVGSSLRVRCWLGTTENIRGSVTVQLAEANQFPEIKTSPSL